MEPAETEGLGLAARNAALDDEVCDNKWKISHLTRQVTFLKDEIDRQNLHAEGNLNTVRQERERLRVDLIQRDEDVARLQSATLGSEKEILAKEGEIRTMKEEVLAKEEAILAKERDIQQMRTENAGIRAQLEALQAELAACDELRAKPEEESKEEEEVKVKVNDEVGLLSYDFFFAFKLLMYFDRYFQLAATRTTKLSFLWFRLVERNTLVPR